MQSLADLTAHFFIADVLVFDEPHPGLLRAQITTPSCKAELYLHGAHLTAWQPTGQSPVIFLSDRSEFAPKKAIRGGVPVIFPWFGPRTAMPNSERTDGPSHGFARTTTWELAFAALAGDDLHLTLALTPDETSRALGYDHFRLALTFILGRELRIRLTVANEGDAPLYFEEALHTYLTVGDVTKVSVAGLADTDYIDKTDQFLRKHQTEELLTLTRTTDRPYLNTTATVTVEDPVLERRLVVSKANSKTTVIWNPWAEGAATLHDMSPDGWRSMICCEAANAADNLVTLAPREAHTMEQHITIDALS